MAVRAPCGIVARAGVRCSHPASERAVTLAGRRPVPTAAGVLDLQLPTGDPTLVLRDADSGVERSVDVHVPAGGVPDRVRVEF